jgi:hypothetical protein
LTHEQLCVRARRWLSGTMRCKPVFSNCASCSEIPDAIGWTSRYKYHGSIVVECKTSRSDFYSEKKKWFFWKHTKHGYKYGSDRLSEKEALAEGYEKVLVPRMGNFRYFFCLPDIITTEMLSHHPDHGLLYLQGRQVRIIVPAPRRPDPDYESEIRFLRFAIINQKKWSATGESNPARTSLEVAALPLS